MHRPPAPPTGYYPVATALQGAMTRSFSRSENRGQQRPQGGIPGRVGGDDRRGCLGPSRVAWDSEGVVPAPETPWRVADEIDLTEKMPRNFWDLENIRGAEWAPHPALGGYTLHKGHYSGPKAPV